MNKTVRSSSEKETKEIAKAVADEVLGLKTEKAAVITLSGDLGAGKTVFTKGFLAELGVKSRITSPTFVVFRRYPVKKSGFRSVYHFDCYRVKDRAELDVLGFKEIISDPRNIVLIEWPENAGRLSPLLKVSIDHLPDENSRRLSISRR